MDRQKRRFKMFAATGALYALLTACATWQNFIHDIKSSALPNRGVVANHDLHAAQGLECSDCHHVSADERMSFVGHDTCAVCHDIPENSLKNPLTFVDDVSCQMCHTRDDYSVIPRQQFITEEIIFDHQVHVTAEVSCTQCHSNPDRPLERTDSLMAQCMDCHQRTTHTFSSVAQSALVAQNFYSNQCAVCHRELTKDTIPQFRHGQRIAHDSPQAWKHLHGQESYVDSAYCAQCHTEQEDCTTCHRIMKPDNHTLAWNRRLHGAHAAWDSQSCSVCHEEDSCIKCHKHTQPVSHRTSFAAPRNNHCVQCHFPPENGCMICHDSIEHRTTPRTPHGAAGGFAGDCALCHPGGVPGAVPHRNNLSADCRICHR